MNQLLAFIVLFSSQLLACGDQTKFAPSSPSSSQTDSQVQRVDSNPEVYSEDVRVSPDQFVPSSAVTQGSFTVYTEPEDPAPREDYYVVIIVQLPGQVSDYRVEDLSGSIEGTDGYQQNIRTPYIATDGFLDEGSGASYAWEVDNDSNNPGGDGYYGLQSGLVSGPLKVQSGQAKLKVFVPGGAHRIEDTIRVRSQILSESQDIMISF